MTYYNYVAKNTPPKQVQIVKICIFVSVYICKKLRIMESITIYPKNEKQKSLLKSLLEEMKVRFEIASDKDDTLMSEQAFFEKIDKSIAQAEKGNTKTLSKDKQKELLGL
jgi:hypothetical protein